MRTILPSLLAAGMLAACAPSVDLEAERAAVHARSESLAAAEAAKDIQSAITYWAEDALLLGPDMPLVTGREAIRDMYDTMFPMISAFEGITTELEVAASGDLAWEHGVNRMTLITPGGDVLDVGKYLAVWKKVDGEWMVAAVAFSSDAPMPAM